MDIETARKIRGHIICIGAVTELDQWCARIESRTVGEVLYTSPPMYATAVEALDAGHEIVKVVRGPNWRGVVRKIYTGEYYDAH